MSSADDRSVADAAASTTASSNDEPTRTLSRHRGRRPKPDNDAFFDRHGRRPAPAVREAIEERTAREEAVDLDAEPASGAQSDFPPGPQDDTAAPHDATEVLSVVPEPGGESGTETGAEPKTAVIVSPEASAEPPSTVKKSSSSEPVHTEPFVEADDEPSAEEPEERTRYAEHMTEPPLPYIEPQPTTPLLLDDGYGAGYDDGAEPVPASAPESAEVGVEPPPAAGEPVARRGTLDLGLLLLRLVVGVTFTLHGIQKLTGWLGGPGPDGFADYLANQPNPGIGFHHNATTVLSLVTGVCETAGGILLILGLLTPIAGAAVLAAVIVTTVYKVTLAGGLWFFAADGGGKGIELEVLLAGAVLALILTGPGTYSFDRRWGWSRRPAWGSAAWAIIAIGAAVAVWIVFNGTDPLGSPGNPAR